MNTAIAPARHGGVLAALLVVYGAASLLHFSHNAEYLAAYPNLPAWLSRADVYLAWVAVTLVGVTGYLLWRRGHALPGLLVLAAYALSGFDGLLHYRRASFSRHSAMMNLTIWVEVAAAALLLGYLILLGVRARRRPGD